MGIQIITTDSGDELVVMSRREYDALLAQLGDEDAEDRMTLLIAAEARGEQALPEQVSAAMLAGDSVLKAVRKWRGLTQAALAQAAGLNQGYLSELEARAKTGKAETMQRLARAMDVPAGWLA
ncbi:helix-turn-helix domain-containing protein [Mesorhizobium sp. B1-1-8]|uniref:helix-turn-helix domain-containing protein n=1 Tax=Mesorhizobium sp. B1-1-8 TaxID=2589976 RepID=UPI00112B4F26|nr:helix-turn-helix domain-containing protein [Mesorhizobium sp. B1-1-8]UCI05061.1 helix-turn-helix domain-containing protein [Mesorhizobium sp. B1-1-8]